MTLKKSTNCHTLTNIIATEGLQGTTVSSIGDKIAAIIGELSLKHIIPDGDAECATLSTTDETRPKKFKLVQLFQKLQYNRTHTKYSKFSYDMKT